MEQKRVAVFVGSLRKASFNRKMAKALISLAPESRLLEIIEIGGLPIYEEDYDDEGRPPAAWTAFREHLKLFDGFIFVTPEYNRSVPAVLKNALDVESRPYRQKASGEGTPGAVISVSPGAIGGFGANHHLRQSLVFLNAFTMQQPEAYIGNAANIFGENGDLANDSIKEFITKFMQVFTAWVETNTSNGR